MAESGTGLINKAAQFLDFLLYCRSFEGTYVLECPNTLTWWLTVSFIDLGPAKASRLQPKNGGWPKNCVLVACLPCHWLCWQFRNEVWCGEWSRWDSWVVHHFRLQDWPDTLPTRNRLSSSLGTADIVFMRAFSEGTELSLAKVFYHVYGKTVMIWLGVAVPEAVRLDRVWLLGCRNWSL